MRVAVVTGAARGIGRAIAARLGSDGHRVVAVDLSPGLADTTVELEREGIAIEPVQVDLTADEGVDAVAAVVERHEGVDVIVNNAGITRDARLVNLTDDDVAAVLDVNLGATYRLTERLLTDLRSGGAVVNLASRAYLGNFGQYNYSMSKGGVVGYTRSLALRLAPGARANAIAPGLIGTEMVMGIPDEVREKMIAAIPLGRVGEPEEVAELVAFLASSASSYLTGQVMVIGGGRSLS